MIIDKQAELSLAQRACDAAAAEASTNKMKIGANVGAGNPVKFHFTVDEAFAGTGTTLTISIQHCATEGGSFVDLVKTEAIAKAALVVGYTRDLILPDVNNGYIQAMYTGDNTFETTGKITCQMVLDTQSNQ